MPELLNAGNPSLVIRDFDAAIDLERCMRIWCEALEVGHPFLGATALDADAVLVREQYMP